MSSSGVFVGITLDTSTPNNWVYGGFIGRNGTAQPLNFPGFAETRGFEINDENWIVGMWEANGNRRRGYTARVNLDTGEQEIHDLGLFPGYDETIAYAINNDRTMVGGAIGGQFGDFEKALIWPEGSLTPQDLNLFVNIPGVTLIDAYRINNAGQILAEARLNDGSGYAYYRLDPIVPEPAFAGVALLAFAGSMIRPRRRR